MAATRKKVKVIGVETYINQATGEIKECQVMSIEERDANFHKLWLGHIIQALDIIGNQKIKVLNFVMENLDKENKLIMTQRKLAEKSGVGINTVIDTMKALQEADFLVKINSGAYQINPNVVFKGGKSARMNVLIQYNDVKQEVAATKSPEEELEQVTGQQSLLDAINEQAATITEPICRHCGSTELTALEGQYGPYYKCQKCNKTTSAPKAS